MTQLVKITGGTDPTSIKVEQPLDDGTYAEIKGITGIDISTRPGEVTTATITFIVGELDIEAELDTTEPAEV